MSFIIGFVIGALVGWITLQRPQWATDAWQWIKHKTIG